MREQTWQKCQAVDGFANPIARAKVTREESARAWRPPIFILCQVQIPIPLEMFYFLSFAFCYGSLQTTTNAKSICQSLWRWLYNMHTEGVERVIGRLAD
jgi:hypothetical protein